MTWLAVLRAARWWVLVRPIRTIKAIREANRARRLRAEAEKAAAGGEFFTDDTETPMQPFILAALRHILTFSGGATLFTDDKVTQIAAALSTLVGVGWSIWKEWKARDK